MNRKNIFNQIREFFEKKESRYKVSVVEDHILFTEGNLGYKFWTQFRCQNFGKTYLLNPNGTLVFIADLEREFDELIIDDLKKENASEFTIAIGSKTISKFNDVYRFKAQTPESIEEYCYLMEGYIFELWERFFDSLQNVENIASYIAQYSFKDHNKVLVSGRFPVQFFKKMFLLYKGGEIDRYQEYKKGLYDLIKSYPEINPKDEGRVPMFMNNFESLVKSLEHS